jgi:hypothetical protein
VKNILKPFFGQLVEEETVVHMYLQQNNAPAYTEENSTKIIR